MTTIEEIKQMPISLESVKLLVEWVYSDPKRCRTQEWILMAYSPFGEYIVSPWTVHGAGRFCYGRD